MPEIERERIRSKIEKLEGMRGTADEKKLDILINFYKRLLKQSEEIANG